MNTILKISLLASLCFSFNCIAALPSDPKQLSFEELANVVDNFQLRREDCQLLQLTAIANKFLNLKVNKKASSQQANPYITKVNQQIKDCKKAHLAHFGE